MKKVHQYHVTDKLHVRGEDTIHTVSVCASDYTENAIKCNSDTRDAGPIARADKDKVNLHCFLDNEIHSSLTFRVKYA